MYVCVDKPQMFTQVAEVIQVLATPHKMLTTAYIKDYFFAIIRMCELIHNTGEGGARVVFCTKTFEAEFQLRWWSP
jgi:hypothetical protein